jgi:hypothetical protein
VEGTFQDRHTTDEASSWSRGRKAVFRPVCESSTGF